MVSVTRVYQRFLGGNAMDEYPPEFDGPDYCLVCGEDVSRAEIWGYIKQEKAIRMVDRRAADRKLGTPGNPPTGTTSSNN